MTDPARPTTPPLAATVLGDRGPRVVLLHGLFGQGRNWTQVARALSADARVTLLDLPDHGRSAWTRSFSYPAVADTVAAHLEHEGGGEPYAVVGHSMGGKVAMVLALARPELVGRLGVVDVSPVVSEQVGGFADYVRAMRALDLTSLPDRAAADAALAREVPDAGVRGFLLQNLRRGPDGWHWQLNLDLLGEQLTEIGGWPEPAGAPYPGPVLWLAGERSRYVRPAYAPAMRALFPRVQLVTVKRAGHWVHAEQPDTFLAVLRRFLHLDPAGTRTLTAASSASLPSP